MKITKKEFQIFQDEFQKWVSVLSLKRWEIRFQHKKMDVAFALCETSLSDMVAWITLNTEIMDGHVSVKMAAKHEALELLLAPLRINAFSRHVTPDEIDEASHGIIRTLEKII